MATDTSTAQAMAKETSDRLADLEMARAAIKCHEIDGETWAYYDDATAQWYITDDVSLAGLADYLRDGQPDAYSRWCSDQDAEPAPTGWYPGARWVVSDEGGLSYWDQEERREALDAYMDSSDFGDPVPFTRWANVSIGPAHEGYDGLCRVRREIPATEPECTHDDGHEYDDGHDQCHGAGIISTATCRQCGLKRTTNTDAQDPKNGEQGLTSVRYETGEEPPFADDSACGQWELVCEFRADDNDGGTFTAGIFVALARAKGCRDAWYLQARDMARPNCGMDGTEWLGDDGQCGPHESRDEAESEAYDVECRCSTGEDD